MLGIIIDGIYIHMLSKNKLGYKQKTPGNA